MSKSIMEAVYFIEPGKLETREKTKPIPKSRELQVKVKACGICTGDVNVFKGNDVEWYYSTWGKPPIVPGHEGVGIISEVGKDIKDLKVGDNVMIAPGGPESGHFAQYVVVPKELVIKIPNEVKDYSLWISEPQTCVVSALYNLNIFPGEDVIIIGCGFMGLLLIQALSRATFIGKIIGVDIDSERLEKAKNMGADEIFNSGNEEELCMLFKKYSKNIGIVVETAGVQQTLDLSNALIDNGGKISIFSWHHGKRSIDGTKWHLGGIKVLNTTPNMEPNFLKMFYGMVSFINRGVFNLDLLITHRMNFTEAQKLMEIAAEPKKNKYLKGVLMF